MNGPVPRCSSSFLPALRLSFAFLGSRVAFRIKHRHILLKKNRTTTSVEHLLPRTTSPADLSNHLDRSCLSSPSPAASAVVSLAPPTRSFPRPEASQREELIDAIGGQQRNTKTKSSSRKNKAKWSWTQTSKHAHCRDAWLALNSGPALWTGWPGRKVGKGVGGSRGGERRSIDSDSSHLEASAKHKL